MLSALGKYISETSSPPPKQFESKFKHVKSIEYQIPLGEDILNNKIQQCIDNGNKTNYDYDNEHGNTVEFRKITKNIEDV